MDFECLEPGLLRLQGTHDLIAPFLRPKMTMSDTVMVMSQRKAAEASRVVMA